MFHGALLHTQAHSVVQRTCYPQYVARQTSQGDHATLTVPSVCASQLLRLQNCSVDFPLCGVVCDNWPHSFASDLSHMETPGDAEGHFDASPPECLPVAAHADLRKSLRKYRT